MVETVSQAYPDIKTRGRQGIELGLIDEHDEGHYTCKGIMENGQSATANFFVGTFEGYFVI